MEMHSRVEMVITKGEHRYSFLMPFSAPAGEAYDAAFDVLEKIVEMAKTSKEKMKRQEDAPKDT